MDRVEYEKLLPYEIVARRKAKPVAYLPLGGLEWHGEHLAVGNDALKAHGLCVLAARRGGGLAFPALWYGEPRTIWIAETDFEDRGEIAAEMELRPEDFLAPENFPRHGEEEAKFYNELLFHTLCQLRLLGYRAIVGLAGHYTLSAVQGISFPAVERFNQKFEDVKAFVGSEHHFYPEEDLDKADGDHAAKWETSYLWYLMPECVDMGVYLRREEEPLIGVSGEDPRKYASREVGRIGVDIVVNKMVRKAEELLKEASWEEERR